MDVAVATAQLRTVRPGAGTDDSDAACAAALSGNCTARPISGSADNGGDGDRGGGGGMSKKSS